MVNVRIVLFGTGARGSVNRPWTSTKYTGVSGSAVSTSTNSASRRVVGTRTASLGPGSPIADAAWGTTCGIAASSAGAGEGGTPVTTVEPRWNAPAAPATPNVSAASPKAANPKSLMRPLYEAEAA